MADPAEVGKLRHRHCACREPTKSPIVQPLRESNMVPIHTARLATPGQDLPAEPVHVLAPLRRDLVVATISSHSPVLVGADWVRIDGSRSPLAANALRRKHAPSPALFDIPGASTRRYRNLLTTTESLVFAAGEDFAWVNLRDLQHPAELEHARCFVGSGTRLSCTVSDPRVLQRYFDEICLAGDCVLLDLRCLGQKLPPSYLDSLMRAVLKRAIEHSTPALLISGLLPTQARRSGAAELGQLGTLLSAGYQGIVLIRETEYTTEPQEAVDLARSLVSYAAESAGLAQTRGSARVLDAGPHGPSGWLRY